MWSDDGSGEDTEMSNMKRRREGGEEEDKNTKRKMMIDVYI